MPDLEVLLRDPPEAAIDARRRHKDEILDNIAERANVAQFVSFGPDLEQRFSRINELPTNVRFATPLEALTTLIQRSPENSINLRSFRSKDSKSSRFIYGLTNVSEAESALRMLAGEGLFTIANETVDVGDGGVSGVLLGEVIEFAPLDTPRCVEKPGLVSIDRLTGLRMLQTVYGFSPDLNFDSSLRVEFSVHPIRRGYLQKHTIVWELEDVGRTDLQAKLHWPNSFSRLLGDKTFGLLVAHVLELPVPATTVFPRRLPPFKFGTSTGTGEVWIRTAPTEQTPGKFSTFFGWRDPFSLMSSEDPTHELLSAVLSQDAVEAKYSGALIPDKTGKTIIEGVRGKGADFMLGNLTPERLPPYVLSAVNQAYDRAYKALGPVRLEWVYDAKTAWIVQMHLGQTLSDHRTIYPGQPSTWHEFRASEGIDSLRSLISTMTRDEGIVIIGEVGITSHLGDILRKARVPSRIKTEAQFSR